MCSNKWWAPRGGLIHSGESWSKLLFGMASERLGTFELGLEDQEGLISRQGRKERLEAESK